MSVLDKFPFQRLSIPPLSQTDGSCCCCGIYTYYLLHKQLHYPLQRSLMIEAKTVSETETYILILLLLQYKLEVTYYYNPDDHDINLTVH